MELGAKLLRHRCIGDVTDQHMAEAEAVVTLVERPVGPKQLLAREGEQDAAESVRARRRSSSATAPRWNSRPSTEARCSTARSTGSSRSMRAARSAWIVAGTGLVGGLGIVGEHREHLLDEEWIAFGRVDDALPKRRRDRPSWTRPPISCRRSRCWSGGERNEARPRAEAPTRTAGLRTGPVARDREAGSALRPRSRGRTRAGRATPARPSGCRPPRQREVATPRAVSKSRRNAQAVSSGEPCSSLAPTCAGDEPRCDGPAFDVPQDLHQRRAQGRPRRRRGRRRRAGGT